MRLKFLATSEKGAVVSKQQLRDVFLNGFRARKETPQVEHTVRQCPTVLHPTLLALTELAEDGEKFWGTDKAR